MALVMRRPRAREDLLEIWKYIADESNEMRADQCLRRLNDAIDLLAQQPLIARARPELGEGIRSFPVHPYVVFHLSIDHGIELVRIIHGSRDLNQTWQY